MDKWPVSHQSVGSWICWQVPSRLGPGASSACTVGLAASPLLVLKAPERRTDKPNENTAEASDAHRINGAVC